MKKLLFVFALTGVLAACSSTPPKTEPAPAPVVKAEPTPVPVAKAPPPVEKIAPAKPLDTTAGSGAFPPKNSGGALGQRSVFYEFDSFAVKEEYLPVVQAHGKFLQDHANAKVFLQGNADERGSREYNLALGQRRADSVRKILTVQGVAESQVESVSYGKEKPRNPGHDDAAWQENRRTDIVYQGE